MMRIMVSIGVYSRELTVDFVLALGLTAVGTFGVVTLASWWM